jgi:hypothetical protein
MFTYRDPNGLKGGAFLTGKEVEETHGRELPAD